MKLTYKEAFGTWFQIFFITLKLQSWAISTHELMEPDFAMWKRIQSTSFPYVAQILNPFLICNWTCMSLI